MKNKLFISGISTFVFSLLVVIYWALLKTNFNFTYPLDDSYIHLAIAKNLAQHWVWGVTKFEFTSASSSPLYTVIIAKLIKLFGNNLYIPLALNIVIGFAIISIATKFIEEQFANIPKVYQYLILNCFILFLPLHTIVFLAMEHTLHCMFVLLLFREFYNYLYSKLTNQYLLPIYAFLSLSTRYETLFILFPIGLVLLYRKDYRLLIFTILASSISIFGFGAYFISNGGRLLPYSVLVKGDSPQLNLDSILTFIRFSSTKAKINTGVTATLLFSLFFVINQIRIKDFNFRKPINLLVLSVLFVSLAHTLFAGPGFFFRYEAYVICLLLFLLSYSLENSQQNHYFNYIIFALIPFIALRVIYSIIQSPQASQNIYEQQIQMANYISKHKEIKSVAVNDIGAIAYFNDDLKVLDLWALATPELSEFVLWEKKSCLPLAVTTALKKELIGKLSTKKDVTHILMYPNIFSGIAQDNWQVYDSLVMKSKRVVCADTLVYYYKVK